MSRHFMRSISAAMAIVILVGCATPPGGTVADGGAQDPCDAGKSAATGALVGALLGGLLGGKDGAAKGAVAGGLVGAGICALVKADSRQTKTAQQTDAELQRAKGGILPPDPTVVTYAPRMGTPNIGRDQPFKVISTVELANGSRTMVQEVKEELQIFNPDNTPFKSGSKPLQLQTAGRYENAFEVTLPKNAPQGIYPLKANLFVNGKLMASRDLRVQLVLGESGKTQLVAAL